MNRNFGVFLPKLFATALIGAGLTLNAFQVSKTGVGTSSNAKEIFPLQKFGRAGTGGDDTAVFRQAMEAASKKGGIVRVPVAKPAYHISPLYLLSNTTLLLDSGVVIQALPGYPDGQKLINIADVSNVQIIGNGSVFKMNRAEYKTGGYRHCISIIGSTDIHIKGLTCVDAGGNGIYIGASDSKPYSENISLDNVTVENSVGPALDLISGKNIAVRRCRFAHSHGREATVSGINMEPNRPNAHLENIRFEDSVTEANSGDGIRLILSHLDKSSAAVSVTVARHRDKATGESSIFGTYDSAESNSAHGLVLFENCYSEGAQQYGAVFSFWNSSGPKALLKGLTVINPNQSRSTIDNVAVAVKRGGGGAGAIGNVVFTETTIRDTRPTPKLDYYFTFVDYSKVGITHVAFSNPIQLTGATHKHPLGLFQDQGIDKIDRPDDPALAALWRKVEHPKQLPDERASSSK